MNTELKSLVRKGEGQKLEFKLKTNHPEKIIREIVAFANSDGGQLLIGISDNKEILGLKYADEDEFVLNKFIEKNIQPKIDFNVEKIHVDHDRWVLVYDIPASQCKPHYVILDENTEAKKAYVRVNDKSIQASKEMREILKSKAKSLKFTFGEKEKILMEFLDKNQKITIAKFAEIAKITKKSASRTLVLLVLTGVLLIQPNELEDQYVLALPS